MDPPTINKLQFNPLYTGTPKRVLSGPTDRAHATILPFLYGKPQMATSANSEDQDEMQHNAAFHQSLHCLLCLKQS